MYNGNENIMICDHPLVKHKITMLRNKNTGTNEFRTVVEEIAMLVGYEALRDLELEEAFKAHMSWSPLKGAPYVANADPSLIEQIAENDMVRGITIACGGFYGPQGRQIRLKTQDPNQNVKIEKFRYNGLKVCNFEMESSALAGLASILGHRAMTCCMVIANRHTTEMNTEYKNSIDTLIEKVLNRI